ncbi:MAG: menaquinone biosynthesis protein [Flavisolibacter sp.]|nr:menaquinone biosynthesis protein [Flavisolibacter sp.]
MFAPKITDLHRIKVAAVNYLNTKPLLYGIKHHPVVQEIDLIEEYPAKIADRLIRNEVDVALLPVASIPLLSESYIISDYCIGSNGAVGSVCLFSDVPMDEIKEVYLDYQSRTSVQLLQVLLREYWKKEVRFIASQSDEYRAKIKGTTAGLVIGDRALEQRLQSAYIYDLGAAWKEWTGLPFVFAAWVANKQLSEEFIYQFNEANKLGLEHLEEVLAENVYAPFDLRKYYTTCISYWLTEEKKRGLSLFFEKTLKDTMELRKNMV